MSSPQVQKTLDIQCRRLLTLLCFESRHKRLKFPEESPGNGSLEAPADLLDAFTLGGPPLPVVLRRGVELHPRRGSVAGFRVSAGAAPTPDMGFHSRRMMTAGIPNVWNETNLPAAISEAGMHPLSGSLLCGHLHAWEGHRVHGSRSKGTHHGKLQYSS